MARTVWTDEEIEWLKEHSHVLTIAEIGNRFNKSEQNISSLLRKLNLDYKKRAHKRIHEFDENFFSKIDTKEKAYLLGLFASDGYIKPGPRNFLLTWKQKDLKLVETIKQIFPTTKDIDIVYNKGRETPYYSIRYGSKQLVSDLQNLGFTNHKSYDCEYPNIPKEYDYHFIRGVIDGDGTICLYNNKIVMAVYGTLQLITSIKGKLGVTNKVGIDKRRPHHSASLSVTGKIAIESLKQIYEDSENLRLERKFVIFDKILKEQYVRM